MGSPSFLLSRVLMPSVSTALIKEAKSPQALIQSLEDRIGTTQEQMNAAQSEAQLDNDQANDVISSLQKELHAFSSHIEQSLPSTNDLAQYKKISEKLQEIQKRVAEQQQTVDTLERAVRKSKILETREGDEWDQQRSQRLEEARNILRKEYHASSSVGDHPQSLSCSHTTPTFCEACSKAFIFPECQITTVTKEFVTLMETVLDGAFRPTTKDSEDMFREQLEAIHCVRMMVELWESVIPRVHRKVIEQVPRVAALYRNDALYIALFIRQLPFRHPLHQVGSAHGLRSTLIGFATSYEKLAENLFNQNLESQIEQILEILHRSGGLHNVQINERRNLVRNIFAQVKQSVSQLSHSWRDVLPQRLLLETLGAVIDRVLQWLMYHVQELDDFSVEESQELAQLFGGLQQETEKQFQEYGEEDRIGGYVANWEKFKKITAIFDMSMVGIVEMWQKGELQEFTASEIHHWICALFSDSAFREKNLAKIQ